MLLPAARLFFGIKCCIVYIPALNDAGNIGNARPGIVVNHISPAPPPFKVTVSFFECGSNCSSQSVLGLGSPAKYISSAPPICWLPPASNPLNGFR